MARATALLAIGLDMILYGRHDFQLSMPSSSSVVATGPA